MHSRRCRSSESRSKASAAQSQTSTPGAAKSAGTHGCRHSRTEPKSTLSLIQTPANNDGLAGARLAINDNNTTGRYLNQQFSLEDFRTGGSDDAVAATIALGERGSSLVIADLPADALLKAADAEAPRRRLFFNVGAIDDRLREEDCRANVIHTAPTRSMLADALAQYLVWKQWRRWLLVVGSHAEDKLYGDALRRSAKRFGARIVQEKVFEDTGGARRTDSGVVQMFLWPRTKARFLRPICRTGPGIRGRSQDPPASFRQVGMARTTNGARYNCRTDS